MKPLIIHRIGEAILGQDGLALDNLPGEFQKLYPNESPKYIDPLSLLAGVAAGRVLKDYAPLLENETRQNFAVILGNGFGAVDSSFDFDQQALLKGPSTVNPMDFPNTVANAAGSRIGIWLQLKGPNITLTNGGTSLMDALGFAFEAYNAGLFQHCLAGAAEKVPALLKPLAAPATGPAEFREGACLLLASGEENGENLFEVVDYFSMQLKQDTTIPTPFLKRYESLWEGVQWLGCPTGTPLGPGIAKDIVRYSSNPSMLELGLSGLDCLKGFLSAPQSCGMIGAFSNMDRKISLIKIIKSKTEE